MPVVVALLSLIGVIGGAVISAHSNRSPSEPKSSITFSGRISASEGGPIVDAIVLATADQTVAQRIRVDANGLFQVQLLAETQSLRLNVSAKGFRDEIVQANVHRTGPEEIYLRRSLVPLSVPLSPSKLHPKAQKVDTLQTKRKKSTGTVQQPINQGIVNNAPNQGIQNNCAPGVIGCDQSIHINEASPLPYAVFKQTPIPAEDRTKAITHEYAMSDLYAQGDLRFDPGSSVAISVDHTFDNASFEVTCNVPCDLVETLIGRVSESESRWSGIQPIDHRQTEDYQVHRIYFEQKLPQKESGSYIKLAFRSRSSNPMSVTAVRTISPR